MRTLDRISCIASWMALFLFLSGVLHAQSKSAASSGGPGALTKPDISPSSLYARNKSSVVTILTFDANKAPLGQGSGFIVAPNRVVTNYHVIQGSSKASVVFDDGTIVSTDSVAAMSGPTDLVILAVKTGGRTPLQLGNELDAKVGETVYAIGSPQGLSASLSNGLVSAFREDAGQFLIQVTTSISPGSSGGPLFDSKGRVIGITTSKLKDGSFGFAVGVSDIQRLLRVPLPAATTLADLVGAAVLAGAVAGGSTAEKPPHAAEAPSTDLAAVQALYDQKKYADAATSFQRLPANVQHSFAGEVLLCEIQTTNTQNPITRACDSAITLKPNDGIPYYFKAMAALALHNLDQAETAAAKAVTLSHETAAKNLLGLIYYMEEKYTLVPGQISEDQKDSFVLTMLEGAAIRSGDKDRYLRLENKIKSIRGSSGPWQSYWDGLAASKEVRLSDAEKAFRKCNTDPDFMDSVCAAALAEMEMKEGFFQEAKKDIDQALYQTFDASLVLNQAIFVHLVVGDKSGAKALHQKLVAKPSGSSDAMDCLYYYSMDQPDVAYGHCLTNLKQDEKSYTSWSNAGYVALDLGRYEIALADLTKASQIFKADGAKHSVTEELDLVWGLLLAEYMQGSKKAAKGIYSDVRKTYPDFSTLSGLEKLPLVWSTQTRTLIATAAANLR